MSAKAQSLEELMARAAIDPQDVAFRAPWQARAFAIALTLSQSGRYEWEEFRRRLIEEVSEPSADDYYRQFLRALEATLAAKGMMSTDEIARRMRELAAAQAKPE